MTTEDVLAEALRECCVAAGTTEHAEHVTHFLAARGWRLYQFDNPVEVAGGIALVAREPAGAGLREALTKGGRCAAQAETAHHGWVQCVKPPFHEDRHLWGDDNQVTPAEPFA